MKLNSKFILIIILSLGLLLRVVNINGSPPSLYGDELTIALDSNALLRTGQDQLGNYFPLTFQMGAGRPAGYVYGSIPFIAIFGTSALGVRALSILSGLGIILLLYYIGRKLFSDKVGLTAAFITAVSIWDISLSRGGFEAHFALFLALLGFYLFIKAKEKSLLYIFSALSFGLTLHTYPTYKVSLLFFLPLLLWYQGIRDRKYFLIGAMLLIILGLSALSQTFLGSSEKRFSDINIFSQEKLKSTIEQKINFERTISNLPNSVSKYFHNKPVEYAKVFIENYLQNFSIDFLILHGDRNPRHNMATMGGLYAVQIILILIGIISFWRKYKKLVILLILWLVLAPIPTAIIDLPHGLRNSFMLPPLILLSGLGLTIIPGKNKLLMTVLGFIFVVQFLFFIQKLYFLSPNEYSSFWSYSAKVASEITIQNKDKYKYIFLSDEIDSIEFAYPVYANIGPSQVIIQNKARAELGGLQFKKFGNVYIGHIPDGDVQNFISSLNDSYLYIGSPETSSYLKNYEKVEGKDNLPILVKSQKVN